MIAICSSLIISASAYAGKTHLTMGMVLEPPHLDPTAGAAAAIDEIVYANVFEGLTRINQNAEVLPALAKSWTISENGLKYTFKLRKGVKFHDGSSFDSSDVIFSLNRARSEKSTNAQKALFNAIKVNLSPSIEMIEVDTEINAPEFSEACAQALLKNLG